MGTEQGNRGGRGSLHGSSHVRACRKGREALCQLKRSVIGDYTHPPRRSFTKVKILLSPVQKQVLSTHQEGCSNPDGAPTETCSQPDLRFSGSARASHWYRRAVEITVV